MPHAVGMESLLGQRRGGSGGRIQALAENVANPEPAQRLTSMIEKELGVRRTGKVSIGPGRSSSSNLVLRNVSSFSWAYRIGRRRILGNFGKIRAIPELSDWEYGIAFSNMAEILSNPSELEERIRLLKESVKILHDYWDQRIYQIAEIRVSPEIRKQTSDRLDWALEHLEESLKIAGRPAEAEPIHAQLEKFRTEKTVFFAKKAPSNNPILP